MLHEQYDFKHINQELSKINQLNFSTLDKDTLIDWEIMKLDEFNEIALEVWIDENNTIKILVQGDTIEMEEISSLLEKEVISHLRELTMQTLNKLIA